MFVDCITGFISNAGALLIKPYPLWRHRESDKSVTKRALILLALILSDKHYFVSRQSRIAFCKLALAPMLSRC